MFGVSVIVCCHNSVNLLPETLNHLYFQRLREGVLCEVIVVDNASTDDTASLARASWPDNSIIPLTIVREPRLGLSYARLRGISVAKYEIVSFIDDDNRICPEWCEIIADIMSRRPEVGACGGYNEPVFDIIPPVWFDANQSCYAVGPQWQKAGDISDSRGYLWGAGLTIRKSAMEDLLRMGFQSQLSDRKGASLSSCGDTELCFALRLAGWRLWYDPRLRLQHYLHPDRLQWSYLRRMVNGFGKASVGLDPYEIAINGINTGPIGSIRCSWLWRTLATMKSLFRNPLKLVFSFSRAFEGDANVLRIESHLGRINELFRNRGAYSSHIKQIQKAKWRKSVSGQHQ